MPPKVLFSRWHESPEASLAAGIVATFEPKRPFARLHSDFAVVISINVC
jgi:hypothetical protein